MGGTSNFPEREGKRPVGSESLRWENRVPELSDFAKPVPDPVNRPAHYPDGKIEVIDFIEDKNLNFHKGNAVKYIARAGKKDPSKEIEDLEKAIWYTKREIERIKNQLK